MARSAIGSYRDVKVWQDAMGLAEACYEQTRAFPRAEMFGLTAQIRRAGRSVAATLAEGHGRETPGAFVQFQRISQGWLKEVETRLVLANRAGMRAGDKANGLLERADELGRMLRALIRSLQVVKPGREGNGR